MTGFYGADVEQLRVLARDVAREADVVDALTARLDGRIAEVAWNGPDARRFTETWRSHLRVELHRVAEALRTAAAGAESNARAQEAVSGSTGDVFRAPHLIPFEATLAETHD